MTNLRKEYILYSFQKNCLVDGITTVCGRSIGFDEIMSLYKLYKNYTLALVRCTIVLDQDADYSLPKDIIYVNDLFLYGENNE